MKKLTKILTITAILASIFAVTSCGVTEAIKDTVEGSYDKWYKYDKGDKQIDIPLVATEQDDSEDGDGIGSLNNADIYFMYNAEKGLTVAIQAVTEQNVEVLGGLVTNKMDLVVGSTKVYPPESFGKGKWAALWGSGKIKKDSAPEIYTNPKGCINLNSEDGPKVQWRKFLANYLLNKLLDD